MLFTGTSSSALRIAMYYIHGVANQSDRGPRDNTHKSLGYLIVQIVLQTM